VTVDANESVIGRWLAAGDAGRFDRFAGLLHDDVVVHAPGGLSTSSRGDEVAVWRAATEAMPDLRHEVQDILAGDGIEMARVVVTGTLRRDFGGIAARNQRLRFDQAVIAHLRDGRIAEAWEIVDLSGPVA
jgi:predicted ester cyclase